MKKYIGLFLPVFALMFVSVMSCSAVAFAAPVSSASNLKINKLVFVDEVTGLSQYTPKQSPRFAIGDKCMIYLEAADFALNPIINEDMFELDLTVDLAIKMPQRKRIIASAKDFNTLKTTVRSKISSTYLFFAFVFDQEWEPGNYIMEAILRDNLSGQSLAQEINFLVEEPNEADLARQLEESKVN